MADAAIIDTTVTAAPKDYLLPGTNELLLKAVRAAVDGSGTASAFVPALQLLAPDGTVMWTAITSASVAAAGSADVSWFPGLSGASSTSGVLSRVFDQELTSTTATLDTGANAIPQTANNLLLLIQARTDEATVFGNLNIRFNGDSTNSYNRQTMRARNLTNSSGIANNTTAWTLNAPGTSLAAGYLSMSACFVPSYRDTNQTKRFIFEFGGQTDVNPSANAEAHVNVGTWASGSSPAPAINQVTLLAGATFTNNLVSGTRLQIYTL